MDSPDSDTSNGENVFGPREPELVHPMADVQEGMASCSQGVVQLDLPDDEDSRDLSESMEQGSSSESTNVDMSTVKEDVFSSIDPELVHSLSSTPSDEVLLRDSEVFWSAASTSSARNAELDKVIQIQSDHSYFRNYSQDDLWCYTLNGSSSSSSDYSSALKKSTKDTTQMELFNTGVLDVEHSDATLEHQKAGCSIDVTLSFCLWEQRRSTFQDQAQSSISIVLLNSDLWKIFHVHVNEMEVGRKIFPNFHFQISGLEKDKVYSIFLTFCLRNNQRRRYMNEEWISYTPLPSKFQMEGDPRIDHPDSPRVGAYWLSCENGVQFNDVTLTNNPRNSNRSNICLMTSAAYEPKVNVVELDEYYQPIVGTEVSRIFPETSFIFVTKYRNRTIEELKAVHDPVVN